jgi:hypothetical protein
MLPSDSEYNISLLSCIQSDGSIDVAHVLQYLNDDVEEHQVDESSLLDCIDAEGGLNIKNFMLRQQEASLLELSILNKAGLIDNSNSPCGSRATIAAIKPFTHRHTRCNLYEVWDGDSRRAATPHDSTWWNIYI